MQVGRISILMLEQIALNSNTYHGYSIEEAIKGAREAGFTCIELAAVADHTAHVRPGMDAIYLEKVKNLLQENELKVIGISAHSNIMRQEGIDNLLQTMELADYFACEYVVTATGDSHGDKDVIEDDQILVQMLIPVLEKCMILNKQLVIETHGNNYATGKDIKRFLSILPEKYKQVVKINYDTANVLFYGGVYPYEDMKSVIQDIGFVHLKDKTGEADEWNFPAIGDGDFDIPRIFDILKASKFSGPISVEIEFTPDGPANLEAVDIAVKRSYEYVKQILR